MQEKIHLVSSLVTAEISSKKIKAERVHKHGEQEIRKSTTMANKTMQSWRSLMTKLMEVSTILDSHVSDKKIVVVDHLVVLQEIVIVSDVSNQVTSLVNALINQMSTRTEVATSVNAETTIRTPSAEETTTAATTMINVKLLGVGKHKERAVDGKTERKVAN